MFVKNPEYFLAIVKEHSISKAAAYASENLETLKEKVQEKRQPADTGTVVVDTYPQTENNNAKEDGENV